ncbi:MAG: hypothetical protein ACTSU5_18595 [Promethearchaeota archaeon]
MSGTTSAPGLNGLNVDQGVVDGLVAAGLSRADAIVYLNLLKLQKKREVERRDFSLDASRVPGGLVVSSAASERERHREAVGFSPSDLLDYMRPVLGKDERWKVYEGLSRLVKRGFVRLAGEKRKPLYLAESPLKILGRVKDALQAQLEVVEEASELATQLDYELRNEVATTLVGYSEVFGAIESAANSARNRAWCVFPPDFSYEPTFKEIARILSERDLPDLEFFVDAERHHRDVAKYYRELGIPTTQIGGIRPNPFGLFLFDDTLVLVMVGSWETYPQYNIGTVVEHASYMWIQAHEYLFNWYKSNVTLSRALHLDEVE